MQGLKITSTIGKNGNVTKIALLFFTRARSAGYDFPTPLRSALRLTLSGGIVGQVSGESVGFSRRRGRIASPFLSPDRLGGGGWQQFLEASEGSQARRPFSCRQCSVFAAF